MQSNDPAGDAATMAHLLNFDSVHGRSLHQSDAENEAIILKVDESTQVHRLLHSQNSSISDTDWSACDLVIEASGKFKTKAELQDYLDQGVKRVIVTAPVKEEGVLNVVVGVNHELYDAKKHPIVTAASCTTNCLAQW